MASALQSRGLTAADTTNSVSLGRKHRPDYMLLVLCLIMLAVGLIVVYAISPALAQAAHTSQTHYVSKQLIAIGLSLVAFVVMAKTPLHVVRQLYKPLLILAGLGTLFALLLPVNPLYPAHRWVRLGGLSFQSVELLKFAILIAAAGFLAERAGRGLLNDFQQTVKPLLIAVGVLLIIVAGPSKIHAQSDLGSTAVILAMLVGMAFVAGISMKKLAFGAAILAIGAVLVILPSQYRRDRLVSYLHPATENCQQAAGYQSCQALIAVGSGGLFGLGLGRSVQAYGYLPEAANDSIFAIFAEKFGFVGSAALLGVIAVFLSRLKQVAERAPDMFSRLLTVGVLAWLSTQAAINIGAMIGLFPLKGITLPFISYGGTSVVFAAAAVGLVFQISGYTTARAINHETNQGGSSYESSSDRRRQRGAYHPNPGSRARA